MMKLDIVKYRAIPFAISSVLFLVSVVLLVTIGLKPGIDFTGGSLMEVSFHDVDRPTIAQVSDVLVDMDLGELQVQPSGDQNMILRMRYITEDEHQRILETLRTAFPMMATDTAMDEEHAETSGIVAEAADGTPVNLVIGEDGSLVVGDAPDAPVSVIEERIETIGPSISATLKERAWEIGLAVIIAIVLFVAYTFRKVSKPVSSWKFGVTAVIALIHDVTITVGAFVLLGYFLGVEVNIPFVVALLTVLGYSVNDTIVVFDRIRENLVKLGYSRFEQVVNSGVQETLVRSLNTSLTTLLVLCALFLFGGDTIKYFAFALIVGIVAGSYSSIFLASPLLVVWERLSRKRS